VRYNLPALLLGGSLAQTSLQACGLLQRNRNKMIPNYWSSQNKCSSWSVAVVRMEHAGATFELYDLRAFLGFSGSIGIVRSFSISRIL
jgi:hypothetical protein